MRWAIIGAMSWRGVPCLVLAGCLAAPPSATGSDDGDAGADPPDGAAGELVPLCPPESVVSHWRFDGDLTSIVDVAGDQDGSIIDGNPQAVPGRFGQAGRFGSEPTGFVQVADADELDLAIGSIEIWVRFVASDRMVVVARDAMYNPDVDGDGHFRVRRDADDHLRVRLQDAVGEVMLESSGPVASGEWLQIVVGWGIDDTDGPLAQLYIDGELVSRESTPFNWSSAINELVFATDQDNAQPGQGTGTPSQFLEGDIDEIVLCDVPVQP